MAISTALKEAILTSTLNFPGLIVVVDDVPRYGVQYLDHDGTVLYAEVVAEGGDGQDPVAAGVIDAPTALIDVSDGVKAGFTRFDAPIGVSNS